MIETNNNTEKPTEDYQTTQHKCVIEGRRFIITRHFVGDKNLSNILMDIATNRANKEMGL